MNRLAVFDCDGTLVDSQAAICRVMAETFVAAGLAAPGDAAVRRLVGLSLPETMAALLPDGAIGLREDLAAGYRTGFRRLRESGTLEEPLFPGMVDLLDRLDADGWLLGVATGKSDRGLRLALERHGLAGRFATLQTADRHPSKPSPAMLLAAIDAAGATADGTVMIGDTSYDMAMAANAGVRALGVAWGCHPAAELRAAGAAAVAESPAALTALMARETA